MPFLFPTVARLSLVYATITCIALMLQAAEAGQRKEVFRGPVEARVVEVLDGDTFAAEAMVWPGHSVRVNIRIRGIDAPEKHARCHSEREAAADARSALAGLIGEGSVLLSNISGAKYYGRVLADVRSATGADIGRALLQAELVRPYGGGRRRSWCG